MPRRSRRRAWGSITESVRGKKYVLRWMENTPHGRRRPCETFYGTYREACARLDEIHVLKASDKPTMTIGQIYRAWYLPWLARRVGDGKTKAGTVKRYRECWAKTVEPEWGHVPVTAVKALRVQEWLMTLPSSNANVAITVLRKIGDFATNYELVETNRFRSKYEMPTRTTRTKGTGVYDFRRAAEVWRKVEGTAVEPAYILAAFGGVRTGESLGVKSAEVYRIEAGGVSFAAVPIVRRMGDAGYEPMPDGDLKTPQSVRTALVPDPFGARLLHLAGRGEWLCGICAPLNKGLLKARWDECAGDSRIPFANLRTSWRTFAQYEWGVDYDTLEVLMGHALPGVTGAHYLKPDAEQLAKKMAGPLAKSGLLESLSQS